MYFDNAATTKVSKRVCAAVENCMRFSYGNPGSIHKFGIEAKTRVDSARSHIAKFFNMPPEHIIFTSGGSEANSLAICGLAERMMRESKTHIVVSPTEHPSVLNAVENLKQRHGFEITKVKVKSDGVVTAEAVSECIRDDTGMVAVMAVNNETGVINPVREIGSLCRKMGVWFHCDCVQAVGTIPINVKDICIDSLSVSGHKFHAPKGVGFAYIRDLSAITPMIFGGGQEFGVRSGTENVPGIVGLDVALFRVADSDGKASEAKSLFVTALKDLFAKSDIKPIFNGNSDVSGGKIVSVRFPEIDGQSLAILLSTRGVCVSTGSACKSNSNEPSHVLKAMGLSDEDALSTIRVSFSDDNTAAEATAGASIVYECVRKLQRYQNNDLAFGE